MLIRGSSVFKASCRDISAYAIDLRYEMLRFLVYTFIDSNSLSRKTFIDRFHVDVLKVFPRQMKKMLRNGNLVLRGGRLFMRDTDISKRLGVLTEFIDTDVLYAAVMQRLKITVTCSAGTSDGRTCVIEKIQGAQPYVHVYNGFGMYYREERTVSVLADRQDIFKKSFYEIVDAVSALEAKKELVSASRIIGSSAFFKQNDHMELKVTL